MKHYRENGMTAYVLTTTHFVLLINSFKAEWHFKSVLGISKCRLSLFIFTRTIYLSFYIIFIKDFSFLVTVDFFARLLNRL